VAAHELKTPMTSLWGTAQVVLRRIERDGTIDGQRLERAFRTMNDQSLKMSRLVEQLLDVSRVGAGRLELDPQAADLRALLEEAVASAQARTGRHTVTLAAPPGPMMAVFDPLRLEQVLTNLLDNAIKYSPNGGPIEVILERDEAAARIAVRDRGLGIPEEHRERVFDRFHQAHVGGHFSGMGLGLYISRQIVELHGGRIWAEFPQDGGTRFAVALPLRAAGQQDAPGGTAPAAGTAQAARGAERAVQVGSGAPAAQAAGGQA
jgi:signal transduction histidine kinase